MTLSRIALVALVHAVSACSEGTGPGTEDGTYALMEVDGASLPVRVVSETWIADTIRLERGDWTRVSVVMQHGEGTDAGPTRRESDGFIRRDGSRIVLDFFCPSNALCVAPDTVYLIAGQLQLTHMNYDDDRSDDPLFRYTGVR